MSFITWSHAMDTTDWHKQTTDQPLFPDMLWSRPENRRHAGKLLIIGGNGYEFKAPANAYGDALNAGIGSAKVLLPDSMQKVVHDIFPEAEFAPTTPSGSFARIALQQGLELAEWADGVLLAGDLGRNSETAIFIESLLKKYKGRVVLASDAVEYCLTTPADCLQRPDTALVLTMAQLQKLGNGASFPTAFTLSMDLLHLVEALQTFTNSWPLHIITKHQDNLIVSSGGQVSTTKIEPSLSAWRVAAAAHAITWWIQNPQKPFEALTTSLLEI
jgi:NAD(P)H-hydrate repair Nnr-like enzyme with NAD(P)H-hydrate dehydratase domain